MKAQIYLIFTLFLFACSDIVGDYESEYAEMFSEQEEDIIENKSSSSEKKSSSSKAHSSIETSSDSNKSPVCEDITYDKATHFCADNGKIYETQSFVYETLTDSRDGKSYKTITIGNQIWMAENLNYNAKNSVCDSCSIFGRFYIWSDNEKYCPTDWHIPSEDEWQILLDAAGGEEIAGFHLKSIEGWSGYGGIDSLGFNGLPSGYHHSFVGESYNGLGTTTGFWTTSSCGNPDYGVYVLLDAKKDKSGFYCSAKSEDLYPIRCIKDTEYLCGSKKYDPSSKFCTNNELYPLCNGEKYNVKTHSCINGKIHALCGSAPYDAAKQFCTENLNIYNLCNGRTYDVETEFCHSENIYDLCNGITYDPNTYTCVGNSVYKYCGSIAYDTTTHFCADNKKIYEMQNFTYGTYSDIRDGYIYKTIEIGSQTWFAENLRYNTVSSSVCDSCNKYGRFYKWSDKDDYCPPDWHLPSEDEWQKLLDVAGGEEIAGFHLKSIEGWSGYGGIDSLGFGGLPSGYHYEGNKSASKTGSATGFWTIGSCGNPDYGTYVLLEAEKEKTGFYCAEKKNYYYSIRCIKD